MESTQHPSAAGPSAADSVPHRPRGLDLPPGATLAFIGGGNMASALMGGVLAAGFPPEALVVVEPHAPQREVLRERFGIVALPQAGAALQQAAVVVWAVKPQLFAEAAAPCAPWVGRALQVSVMAGVRCAALERATGTSRIVRTMPNTPALIGQGMAGLFAAATVSASERALVEGLFAPTGRSVWVGQESDLDAVTAVSGSGPAYAFYLIEAMVEAALAMGLEAAQARDMAVQTVLGAALLAQSSPLSPAELRAQVTSKGGTTHAALTHMEAAGVKTAVVQALQAAQHRARELGDALDGG